VAQSSLFTEESQTYIMPVLILLIRLQGASIASYGYHMNQQLFPILIRGRAFGITHLVSRPFGGLATILVEYTDKPMVFALVFSLTSMLVMNRIKVIDGYD
jgi:hypothetical protein